MTWCPEQQAGLRATCRRRQELVPGLLQVQAVWLQAVAAFRIEWTSSCACLPLCC